MTNSLPNHPGMAGVPTGRIRELGDFVLQHEVGRGGMGVVWQATQKSIARKVALKVLPRFAGMDANAVARFRREAESAGRLAHPGIVPIYAVGEDDGVYWFAMELIDGPSLAKVIDGLGMRRAEQLRASLVTESQLSERYPAMIEPATGPGSGNAYVRSCARLIADVAEAVAAAHRERVIHRDLKPSNILIHPAGRPVLLDFGLARDEQAQNLTMSGEQVGTPAYMAPEQVRGRKIDARVDIYGLGAVLYELLTLRPPFEGGTAAETMHAILTDDPVPVQVRNKAVPVDLAAIVQQCLAKEPDARYAAVEALALDLRNFLAGRPVLARLPGRLARLTSGLQRHRRSLQVGCFAAAAATGIAFVAGVVNDRGDIRVGEQALVDAGLLLVESLDVAKARDAYERAAALTKDPSAMRVQRRIDFAAAFARHWSSDEPGARTRCQTALRQFAAVFDDADRKALADLLARLDGRGTLRLASRTLEQRTKQLQVRALAEEEHGDLDAEWREVVAGEALPKGEYLVRAISGDGEESVLWARVAPDQDVAIVPRYLGAGRLPDDAVVCVDPRTNLGFAVDRTEVTRSAWRQWLRSLPAELCDEMTPQVWSDDVASDDLPVRGLSFHQARMFATMTGTHLPTAREHWLAASVGLEGLAFPWGRRADVARIAADPFQFAEAEPVRSRPGGCSPLGVFHLLGNVAEIHAAVGGAPLAMGGGHFLDDPKSLRLQGATGTVPTAPLAGVAMPHPGAGLRSYRFLAFDSDGRESAIGKALQERREELRHGEHGCVLHDWSVASNGAVRCEIEFAHRYDGGARERELLLAVPGFVLRRDGFDVQDGFGQPLPAAAVADPTLGGEAVAIATQLPATLRAGQGYRYKVIGKALPTSGLVGDRDGHVARIPMRAGGRVAQVYALTLPAGSQLIGEPAPRAQQATRDGRLLLVWERPGGLPAETAVVRFRVDGGLTPQPPSWRRTETAVREFMAAWNDRTPRLASMLGPEFLQRPGDLERSHVVRGLDRFRDVVVEDVTAVGDVCTAELRVTWDLPDAGGDIVLTEWPMQLQFVRRDGTLQALRLQPRSFADQGRFEGDGVYRHRELRVGLAPPAGAEIARTHDELVPLQIDVRAAGDERHVKVLGWFAAATETEAAVRFRLTAGAATLRGGRRLTTAPAAADGWSNEVWEFPSTAGTVVRERWWFTRRGLRHLLVREIAPGADPIAAQAMLERGAEWSASVRAKLTID
ncbi:MAG: protein kinase [Planctomycetes bacterium]|nr:protein kinase [Planctomycetota bacterium]